MKHLQIVISILLGVAAVAAFGLVVSWPWAILSGTATGYFSYRFRSETWPAAQNLVRFLEQHWFELILGLGAVVLLVAIVWFGGLSVVYVHDHIDWDLVSQIFAGTVLTTLTLLLGFLLTRLIGKACALFLRLDFHLMKKDAPVWLDDLMDTDACFIGKEAWSLQGLAIVFPLALTLTVVLLLIKLVIQIYRLERALIALSVALGGWLFFVERWASASPIVSLAVGMFAGSLAGVIQYELITRPLQRHYAAKVST